MIELINALPILVDAFLPGFLFMAVYTKLFKKIYDKTIIFLWSLFISSLIHTFWSLCHVILWAELAIPNSVKQSAYILTGLIIPFILWKMHRSKLFKRALLKSEHRTINKNIFDDIIDYDRQTVMRVYLKNSNIMYVGTFVLIEEKETDPFISLIRYASLDKNTYEIIYEPDKPSSVLIKMSDIERLEIVYVDGSNVWKQLNEFKTEN